MKAVNESIEKLIRSTLSDKEMYLLWAATHDLNPSEDGPKLFPTEIDMISIESQQMLATKEKIMGVCENIENSIRGIQESKNTFIDEMDKLDKIMKKEVYDKMNPETVNEFIKHVEQVELNLFIEETQARIGILQEYDNKC